MPDENLPTGTPATGQPAQAAGAYPGAPGLPPGWPTPQAAPSPWGQPPAAYYPPQTAAAPPQVTPAQVVQMIAQAQAAQAAQTRPARGDDGDDDAPSGDLTALPSWARREIRKLRDESAGWRVRHRESEESGQVLRAAIAEAAGLDVDRVTPETLGELFDYLAGTANRNLMTTEALKAAVAHGADPLALLSWTPFTEAAAELDPTEADFSDQVSELVRYTVENTAILRAKQEAGAAALAAGQEPDHGDADLFATPEPASHDARDPRQAPAQPRQPHTPARSGAEFAGAPGTETPITESDLPLMTAEQITTALSEGRLNHLL